MDMLGTLSASPAVCPRLIGRDGSFGLLTGFVGEARAGRGRTVLISGEAGIGKSRLVAETRARATAPDGDPPSVRVMRGSCFEPDRACPYAPLLDMLRNELADRSAEQIAVELGPVAGELAKLLPEIASIAPSGNLPPPLTPEHEKRRLFHALLRLFAGFATVQPLLVIAEDLHWSDDTSLEFLLALARRVSGQRILLLLTYRSDEVHPGLRHTLAEFDRERLATEIALTGLSRAEVDAMLRAILRLERPPRADVVEEIFSLTDGNPFFIEEVLRSLGAAGRAAVDGSADVDALHELAVPRTVQDAVQQRLATLSPDARRVLDLAAVAGRRFDFALLRDLTALDEAELLARIKEAIAAQVVTEESADRFAFRHALTRQAVYTRLLARERRDLHRMIAERLEAARASRPDVSAGDLAYHFFEAGTWHKAVTFSQIAAERALTVDASTAAISHTNRALAAADRLTEPPPPGIYRIRGQAYETLGEFDRARGDFQAALNLARARGDRQTEWQALLDLGTLSTGHDYDTAGHFLRSAADLARSFPDRRPYAQSLNRLGNWYANTGHVDEAAPIHREALAVFQAAGDRRGTAETLDLLGMASGLSGDLRAAVDHYDQAIALFRELRDRRGTLASLTGNLVWKFAGHFSETVVSPSSDIEAARRAAAEALDLARSLHWRAMESFAGLAIGANLAAFGALGEGLTYLRESHRIATEIGHQQWTASVHLHLSRVYLYLLHPDHAAESAETGLAYARALGSALWLGVGTSYLALAHLLMGRPDHAETVLRSTTPLGAPTRSLAERLLALTRGELALAQGDAGMALEITDMLIASVPGGPLDQPIPALLKLRGEALLALDQPDDAIQALVEAKRGALLRGTRPFQWQIQATLARALRIIGHLAEAAAEEREAQAAVLSLAASIEDQNLRQHFLRAAVSFLPTHRRVTADRHASAGGLTTREQEVATLLAQHRSNREIAGALFIGERTVESHVASILAKLGCSSRAQVVNWLIDHGDVERPT